MHTEMKKILSFQWGQEKQIRISRVGSRESLFYEAYRQAMAGVAEIVYESGLYSKDRTHYYQGRNCDNSKLLRSDYLPESDRYFYNYPSNTIVFAGERGVGKSSALLTFVDSLVHHEDKLFSKEFLEGMVRSELTGISVDQVEKSLENVRFLSMTPIDPTKLEDGSHILAVILAKMFRIASEAWEREEGSHRQQERLAQKNCLLKHFAQCYKHILAIKNIDETKDFQVLDTLEELGDSVELKQEFATLVEELLGFCLPEAKDSFLILQIDDTDMNVKYAYEILEDIRKYLVIPRVIIIMAADLNHLTSIVAKEFMDNSISSDNGANLDLATQYIIKFFPQTRQVWLPSLKSYLKEHSNDVEICNSVMGKPVLPNGVEFENSQDQIFRLIYQKTGIIYLKKEDQFHYIIPDNMRALSHFLGMLSQMKTVVEPDSEEIGLIIEDDQENYQDHLVKLRARLENVQRFRQYFMHTWMNNNLSVQNIALMNSLHQMSIGKKIAFIYHKIVSLLHDQGKNATTDSPSYANLMFELNCLENNAPDEQYMKLSFAIRNYFSLLAHCMVLGELISWYEKQIQKSETKEESEDHGDLPKDSLNFLSLYPIFASQLFRSDIVKSRIIESSVFEGSEEGTIFAHWCPKLPNKDELGTKDLRKMIGILCTLFFDYKAPDNQYEEGKEMEADWASYILNCLYISKDDAITPLVKNHYGLKETDAQLEYSCDAPNVTFRNHALLVVLNSDVQQVIDNTVHKYIKAYDKKKNQEFTEVMGLGNVFHIFSSAFNPAKASLKWPIKCLSTLDLGQWITNMIMNNFTPVIQKATEPSKDNTFEIATINAFLTQTKETKEIKV